MQKIKIVCTSSGGMDPTVANKLGIDIIPILIEHNGKQYREGLDIDADAFFQQLEITAVNKYNLPKTVIPTAISTIDVVIKAITEGYTDIIFVCMSTALGSAFNKIRVDSLAFRDQINLHMFDTKAIGYVEAYLAIYAQELAQSGADVNTILEKMAELRKNAFTIGATTNLDYPVYNGRLKGALAFWGKTLNIKPSLEITANGELVNFAKSFHSSRAFFIAAEKIKKSIGDSQNYLLWRFRTGKANEKYLSRAEEKIGIKPNAPDFIMPLSTGVHTGPTLAGWGLIKFENC
jgi:DegV family protein with EDD domain